MHIDIRSRGFSVTPALAAHAEHRLRAALARFDEELTRVSLRLSDENGPRGGIDKRCSVEVRVRHRDPIVTQALEEDAYVAIDQASQKAGRAVKRRLARRRL